jgi:dimethylhistidine N-methyltransferase
MHAHQTPRRDATPESDSFAQALLTGLSSRPRALPAKFFYDAEGSALFEKICDLPEYYPTRTDMAILERDAAAMADRIGADAELIEFGAGSSRKVRTLLGALVRPRRYVPIDISGEHLTQAIEPLAADYPGLSIRPLIADYTRPFALPSPAAGTRRRVGFFPGSTVGNFTPEEAIVFLHRAAGLLAGGGLLIGVDLVKEPARLHAAYNDAAGVTAAFNLNLLARANRETASDFDLARFAHYAFYNAPLSRIEMHLVSRRRQTVTVLGRSFGFAEGEAIHTENSYKYTVESFRALAETAGFLPGPVWTDAERLFSVHWLDAPRRGAVGPL